MRFIVVFCLAIVCAGTSQAQNQEPSLIDRLLRPNMELKNSAQEKKFTPGSAVIEKSGGTVGTFYLRSNRTEQSFQDLRVVSARKQSAPKFYAGADNAALSANRKANAPTSFPTSSARELRNSDDANKKIAADRRFAGEDREFREEGKSQKSLNRHNRPMTIDEVRELLNKNK